MSIVALDTFLKPLAPWLEQTGVTELSINRPGEMWVEKDNVMHRLAVKELDESHLLALAQLIAAATQQEISPETPLLSATLPAGHRVQIVLPPAAEAFCLSIRKPSILDYTLDHYGDGGSFNTTRWSHGEERRPGLPWNLDPWTDPRAVAHEEKALLRKEQGLEDETASLPGEAFLQFIRRAIGERKNVLISGGTSTGKTTFLNACLREIPESDRIITIEDTREVRLRQPNCVHLLASRGGQGRAQVTPQQLIEASLRLRPDRIIMGELRGVESFAFLRAINTGHPGSLATLHADTPTMAFEQLALMVFQAGFGMTRDHILDYLHHVIPVVIQLQRDPDGRRFVSEIYDAHGGATT